jgi:glycolate oxidase FAD binding subunit
LRSFADADDRDHLMVSAGLDDCWIDDFGPLPVVQPTTELDIQDQIRRAVANKLAIYPLGGRTQLHYGGTPRRRGLGIDLTKLSRIIDYPARDMTVTVQAGITMAGLQAILRSENQRLPVDVSRGDQATLGGAMAVNASGSLRFGFGTLRDYVIGISVINDLGESIKAGGRVVKNVAGYDLCKLYVGSLGTLGIIHQVTLKLRPLPEERALVLVGCEPSALPELLDEVHRSQTRPVAIDLLNSATARSIPDLNTPAQNSWTVVIGYQGNCTAVNWQVERLVKELSVLAPGAEIHLGPAVDPIANALAELPLREPAGCTFKANLLPSATAPFCVQANQRDWLLYAHAGSGIVWAHAPPDQTLDQAQTMLDIWRQGAAAAQGAVTVTRCPAAWKETLPIWDQARPGVALMRAIKNKLDPQGLFNPGRFIDGI